MPDGNVSRYRLPLPGPASLAGQASRPPSPPSTSRCCRTPRSRLDGD